MKKNFNRYTKILYKYAENSTFLQHQGATIIPILGITALEMFIYGTSIGGIGLFCKK